MATLSGAAGVPAAEPVPGPIGERERFASIDVLRGVALLGILVMNIQGFAMISAAYMNPTAYGDLTGVNYVIWYAGHLLADMKFMSIFSMLFGAGIVVMASRREERGHAAGGLHYRRMGWLLLIGMLHAYGLWYGDILVAYAVCGMLAFPFRRMPIPPLVAVAVVLLAVPSAMSIANGLSLPTWRDQSAWLESAWSPGPEVVAEEIGAYRGGWIDQSSRRVPAALMMQIMFLALYGGRPLGCIFLGMALYRLGILQAARSRALYAVMLGGGLAVGLPLILFGIARNEAAGWSVEYSFFLGTQYNYWASMPVAFAWIGLVMLVCRSGLVRLTAPLAAVGRMALTNYLLQTIICTTIFYGHGLGLFGRLERWEMLAVVAGVWLLQLAGSPIWLRFFRFGPAEWLWRSLSYLRLQPLRR